MGHLDELYSKYKDKGLMVIAITNEDSAKVSKFVSDTSATHPIVIENGDSSKEYGIKGFPSSFVIGADGNVAWSGHPASIQEDLLERLLQDVRLMPELPKSLSSVGKSIEKGDMAKARADLEKKLEGGSLERDEAEAARAAVAWIDDRGNSMLTGAKKDIEAGRVYEAWATLEKLSGDFKKLPQGDEAEALVKDLEGNKDQKREIDAGKALDSAKDRAKKMKSKQQAALFKAIASKYKGTKAGDKAADMAAAADK